MKYKLLLTVLFFNFYTFWADAQNVLYTVQNTHSHNDYENPIPFLTAYNEQFGSIEADVFLAHDSLIVGHTADDMQYKRTLQDLYLNPLNSKVRSYNGYPYKNTSNSLQLLIDIKTEAQPTLNRLIEILRQYPDLTGAKNLQFVISGNKPSPDLYTSYPDYIYFDGDFGVNYTQSSLHKILLFSDDLKNYTEWNGKGIIPAEQKIKIDSLVRYVHSLNKKIRFWASPDFTNAWYQLMHENIDYINTDHITALAAFLNNLNQQSITINEFYNTYQPTYLSDGTQKKIKNIILLIGDGCSWPQLYAAYTANHANLNIFKIKNTGTSKTSSYDSYITDSAPGSTSIASGIKTNNRYVGVDHTGNVVPLLPLYFSRKNIKTGLITCGDITDATPADFYAHQKERDNSAAIFKDLKNAPVTLLMGSGNESLNNVKILSNHPKKDIDSTTYQEIEKEYDIVTDMDQINDSNRKKKWILMEKKAGLSMLNGRGNWLQNAFKKSVSLLGNNKNGFFLMVEGAQIDYGGHANNLPYVVQEVLDFDKTVGDALKFADANGETLVLVTADHETGGLTLLDGDYKKGYVSCNFVTNDHTALPVPVFAYGPKSSTFSGIYENTEIFNKIMEVMGISKK